MAKGYGIKCGAIGDNLRNTWELEEHIENNNISKEISNMLQVGVCHMLKLGWWENHRLLNIKDAKKKTCTCRCLVCPSPFLIISHIILSISQIDS